MTEGTTTSDPWVQLIELADQRSSVLKSIHARAFAGDAGTNVINRITLFNVIQNGRASVTNSNLVNDVLLTELQAWKLRYVYSALKHQLHDTSPMMKQFMETGHFKWEKPLVGTTLGIGTHCVGVGMRTAWCIYTSGAYRFWFIHRMRIYRIEGQLDADVDEADLTEPSILLELITKLAESIVPRSHDHHQVISDDPLENQIVLATPFMAWRDWCIDKKVFYRNVSDLPPSEWE